MKKKRNKTDGKIKIEDYIKSWSIPVKFDIDELVVVKD